MKQKIKNIFVFILVLYAIFIIDWIIPFIHLNQWGITPRTLKGLIGVFFAPFLHGSFTHILSNTIPLAALLFLLFSFYQSKSIPVLFLIVVLGGLGVWIFGRSATHIGASGVIYGLVSFLVIHGFMTRNVRNILVSILVAFLYGGIIWGIFPNRYWVSWEGHLFGAIAGIFAAYFFRKQTKNIDSDSEQGV